MTKRRCKTCQGREGCIHLSIFKQAVEEDDLIKSLNSMRLKKLNKDNKKTEVSSDLQDNKGDIDFNKKPSPMPQENVFNPLNPKIFTGSKANVFKQQFNFPANMKTKLKTIKLINQASYSLKEY